MATHKPLINGFAHDFGSITCSLGGEVEDLIKDIKYAISVERGKVAGTSMKNKGHTRGQMSFECSITFSTRQAFQDFVDRFGERAFLEPFTIGCSYGKDGQPIITDALEGVKLKKPQLGASYGTDAVEVACECDIMNIKMGGSEPLPEGL